MNRLCKRHKMQSVTYETNRLIDIFYFEIGTEFKLFIGK